MKMKSAADGTKRFAAGVPQGLQKNVGIVTRGYIHFGADFAVCRMFNRLVNQGSSVINNRIKLLLKLTGAVAADKYLSYAVCAFKQITVFPGKYRMPRRTKQGYIRNDYLP